MPTGVESMWVDEDDGNALRMEDDEEEEALPSVFDRSTTAIGKVQRPEVPLKHSASALFPERRRVPREMGYIERLAAGLLHEEAEAQAERDVSDAVVLAGEGDRVSQLEYELEVANAAIMEREVEIKELRERLDELAGQVVLRAEG
jgi:hypothetical protein